MKESEDLLQAAEWYLDKTKEETESLADNPEVMTPSESILEGLENVYSDVSRYLEGEESLEDILPAFVRSGYNLPGLIETNSEDGKVYPEAEDLVKYALGTYTASVKAADLHEGEDSSFTEMLEDEGIPVNQYAGLLTHLEE